MADVPVIQELNLRAYNILLTFIRWIFCIFLAQKYTVTAQRGLASSLVRHRKILKRRCFAQCTTFFGYGWHNSKRRLPTFRSAFENDVKLIYLLLVRRTECESYVEAWWRGDDVGLWCTNQRTQSRSTVYISVLISCLFNQNWVTFLTASLTKYTRYKSHRNETPRVTITSSHTVCLLGICIRTLTSQPKILQ